MTSARWPPSSQRSTSASACGSTEKRIARKNLASVIELRIAAEDALLIEGNAPLGGEIGGQARAARDAVVQIHDSPVLLFHPGHGVRKSVPQPFDHLEERQM